MLSVPRILSLSCLCCMCFSFCLLQFSFLALVRFSPLCILPLPLCLPLRHWFPHLSSFHSLACMLFFSLYSMCPFFCMYLPSLVHFLHLTAFCFLSIDYSYPLILAFTFPDLGTLSLAYAAVFLPPCADLEAFPLTCVLSCSVTCLRSSTCVFLIKISSFSIHKFPLIFSSIFPCLSPL